MVTWYNDLNSLKKNRTNLFGFFSFIVIDRTLKHKKHIYIKNAYHKEPIGNDEYGTCSDER